MLLELRRFSFTKHGTFGALGTVTPDGIIPICLTLEDPWFDNQPNIGCIPPGAYLCKRIESKSFGDVFEITNVIGRTGVLLHKGNTVFDTHGCILLGASFENTNFIGISRSQEGYNYFSAATSALMDFQLIIRNP